jgi:hypothetical protein
MPLTECRIDLYGLASVRHLGVFWNFLLAPRLCMYLLSYPHSGPVKRDGEPRDLVRGEPVARESRIYAASSVSSYLQAVYPH